jgi:hypothetical protein
MLDASQWNALTPGQKQARLADWLQELDDIGLRRHPLCGTRKQGVLGGRRRVLEDLVLSALALEDGLPADQYRPKPASKSP